MGFGVGGEGEGGGELGKEIVEDVGVGDRGGEVDEVFVGWVE